MRGVVLVCLLASFVAAVCAGFVRCSCALSTSSTDRETRWRHARAVEEYNRPFASFATPAEAVAHGRREYQAYKRRYEARFHARIVPGMGCDACPWLCATVDLSAVDKDEFQARYREGVRLELHGRDREERYVGFAEQQRLECMAIAHWPRMRQAVRELMQPSESPAVRYRATEILVLRGLDMEHTLAALAALAAEDHDHAEAARHKLDELRDAGTPGVEQR